MVIKTFNNKEIREKLSNGICRAKFVKIDGELRTMHCTTNTNYIPEDKYPKGSGVIQKDNIITAFDVDIDLWRCFDLNRLREFSVL